MLGALLTGAAAGAVGTVALNVTTYLDMLVRARSSSGVPAKTAGKLAEVADVPLRAEDEEEAAAQNRKSALGALLGYVTGLGVGAAYGLVRPSAADVPRSAMAVALGAAAMAGSDVPATLLGVTDPRKWGTTGWASDIIPHLVYGLFTVVAYDSFTRDSRR